MADRGIEKSPREERANTDTSGFMPSGKPFFYASEENELFRYEVDIDAGTLTLCGSTLMPAPVMYGWSSPSGRCLYIGSSDRAAKHFLNAFRIDPTTGALFPHGQPVLLPERVVNVTLDRKAACALLAFNKTGTVRVYRLAESGEIGEMVVQAAFPDGGFHTHQVRVSPAGDTAFAVGRGNNPRENKPEDLGSLTLFRYRDGFLTEIGKIEYAPGLGPRHMDFHPSQPWAYVSVERGNKLYAYALENKTLRREPLFIKETLSDPSEGKRERQMAGAIHCHPGGQFLYLSNRCDGVVKDEPSGKMVHAGGENNIAVYALDQDTGEPTLIQNADTRGVAPRTFSIDPSGRLLVAANQSRRFLREGGILDMIPRSLSIFRIGPDGKLEYVRKYDVGGNDDRQLFWSAFAGPGR